MSLRPSGLPKARAQLLRHLEDPASALRSTTSEAQRPGLEVATTHVRAADLYWVTKDMAALAVSAGGQLAAARWATADRPSACGLIYFDGGIGMLDAQGVEMPVDAMTWGPSSSGCEVGFYMDRRRVDERLRSTGMTLVKEDVPPLVPMVSFAAPVTTEPHPMAELDDEPAVLFGALAAAWLLMQQPQLVDRTRERADGPTRRAHARQNLPSPDITVVDLRRQYTPQDRDPDAGGDGRTYRHRWVVSGHWRNQAYGPGQSLRRKTYVPAYVKGPDGAPLLSTEKVNVWRR
ncbi:hypothetical protein ACIP93_32885 [Streptomyces sp. NPDC088745]|uniref:hypothetical protein n=1 Tax=Streptomyces sp. NPDC088745 TaxID=3365884 RepID=UPI00380DC7C0